MAKKKAEKSEGAVPKSPAKEAAVPAKAAKPAKPQAAGVPMIDTSLAAAAAARMLAFSKRAKDDQKKSESSLVKQIKNELNRPHAASVSNVLNKSMPQGAAKPSSLPFDQKKQVGHNQTFGPDVTRTGVPRRTSG